MHVECYAGYRGEEEPRRLRLDDRTVEVVSIEDRWTSPGERGFRVRGDDGRTYVLRHDTDRHTWRVDPG